MRKFLQQFADDLNNKKDIRLALIIVFLTNFVFGIFSSPFFFLICLVIIITVAAATYVDFQNTFIDLGRLDVEDDDV